MDFFVYSWLYDKRWFFSVSTPSPYKLWLFCQIKQQISLIFSQAAPFRDQSLLCFLQQLPSLLLPFAFLLRKLQILARSTQHSPHDFGVPHCTYDHSFHKGTQKGIFCVNFSKYLSFSQSKQRQKFLNLVYKEILLTRFEFW